MWKLSLSLSAVLSRIEFEILFQGPLSEIESLQVTLHLLELNQGPFPPSFSSRKGSQLWSRQFCPFTERKSGSGAQVKLTFSRSKSK
tara:strand:+ start:260 stop:520 length:261 start_codon:yes stop_codon:yes gene_type:complete